MNSEQFLGKLDDLEYLLSITTSRRNVLKFGAGFIGQQLLGPLDQKPSNPNSTHNSVTLPGNGSSDEQNNPITAAEIKAGLPIVSDPLLVRNVDKGHLISQKDIDTQIIPQLANLHDNSKLVRCPSVPVLDPALRIHRLSEDSTVNLINTAWQEGKYLYARSGFRTIRDQGILFQNSGPYYNSNEPPGASQHHTGLPIDFTCPGVLNTLSPYFEQTPEGIWMTINAPSFGFVPVFINHHDGIKNEPWHYLYVGQPLAKYYQDLKKRDWTGDIFDLLSMYPNNG
jgi:hypothetical protein